MKMSWVQRNASIGICDLIISIGFVQDGERFNAKDQFFFVRRSDQIGYDVSERHGRYQKTSRFQWRLMYRTLPHLIDEKIRCLFAERTRPRFGPRNAL